MARKIVTLLLWTFLGLTSVVCLLVAVVLWVVTAPFDPQRRVNHMWSCAWASIYAVFYPGWKVRTIHRDRIAPNQAYVMAANHTSIADIVLLFTLFRQFKWVSKRENFNLPILGWNMWLSKYIPLVRGDATSTRIMLERCRKFLREGMSIMMFPEGTRSRDGRVKPFKHGAFTLAHETGVPVVPIAIHGGHALIPKHGTTFAATAELTVEVLEPIPSTQFDDPVELGNAVRRRIVEALASHDRTFALGFDGAVPGESEAGEGSTESAPVVDLAASSLDGHAPEA
ncbi:lysophospholipid acyltransferase family protein [Pendulispora albinea]|uniref:1-acyl-sn-glycerol-3-phosphate acyltransferase n=1 Tax=Pendulispora albinea TaxID=2741071 RepID=A0ABZ2M026_9BACT